MWEYPLNYIFMAPLEAFFFIPKMDKSNLLYLSFLLNPLSGLLPDIPRRFNVIFTQVEPAGTLEENRSNHNQ